MIIVVNVYTALQDEHVNMIYENVTKHCAEILANVI
jgi:hypothetical protein